MIERRSDESLLRVRQLVVEHHDREFGIIQPLLRGVDLDLAPGQALALVGPSGCGKSLTARAVLGLLPAGFAWCGDIAWQGTPLSDPHGVRWRAVRGRGLGLIMQEPLTSLNPVLRVGDQIAESLRVHGGLARGAARDRAVDLLAETRVPEPARAARRYPHELSGGMRQRVLLAAVLACDPQLLIADEPTTALDMPVQKEILALINRVRRERNMALLFITHDQNLVPLLADEVAVMAAGQVTGVHAVAAMTPPPSPAPAAEAATGAVPVLSARQLTVHYPHAVRPAVADVDLDLLPGRAIGLLGESGCGKTSLARALAGHISAQTGSVKVARNDDAPPSAASRRADRRRVQMLFQDPGGSLDPRQRVDQALREAAGSQGQTPAQLLREVGLDAGLGQRYPHQLSGGQRQRVALARCLAPAPQVLIADEPTSALDDRARDIVLALLDQIVRERGLALLLISHDLEVLQSICAEVQVMYGGRVVEVLPSGAALKAWHPYTQELLRALPRNLRQDPRLWAEESVERSDLERSPGGGCPFYGNCRLQKPRCGKELPTLLRRSPGHWLRCPEAETPEPSHFIDT
jgi:peptide/nickel transport system ATP-binding protein